MEVMPSEDELQKVRQVAPRCSSPPAFARWRSLLLVTAATGCNAARAGVAPAAAVAWRTGQCCRRGSGSHARLLVQGAREVSHSFCCFVLCSLRGCFPPFLVIITIAAHSCAPRLFADVTRRYKEERRLAAMVMLAERQRRMREVSATPPLHRSPVMLPKLQIRNVACVRPARAGDVTTK